MLKHKGVFSFDCWGSFKMGGSRPDISWHSMLEPKKAGFQRVNTASFLGGSFGYGDKHILYL